MTASDTESWFNRRLRSCQSLISFSRACRNGVKITDRGNSSKIRHLSNFLQVCVVPRGDAAAFRQQPSFLLYHALAKTIHQCLESSLESLYNQVRQHSLAKCEMLTLYF